MRLLANSSSELLAAFADLGKAVSPRPFRTHDEKEFYCLRRYIFTLAAHDLVRFPLVIDKSETPDFIVSGAETFGIEVVEATDEADQKEYSIAAKSGRAVWFNGDVGGRGRGGFSGVTPERLWWSYMRRAIERKLSLTFQTADTRILVYSNSNAGSVVDPIDAMSWINQVWIEDPDLQQLWSHSSEISIIKGSKLICDIVRSLNLLEIRS